MNAPTTEQIRQGLRITLAAAEVIKEMKEIPSGHLYVLLMDKMDIHAYNAMIQTLIGAGLIRKEPSHLLVWTGPTS